MAQPTSFSSLLAKVLSIGEKLCLVILLIGIALKYLHSPGANEALMISLSGLAGIMYLTAFRRPQKSQDDTAMPLPEDAKPGFMELLTVTIAPKMAGIGGAVCIIGILFTLLHMPGSNEMLSIGIFGAGAAAVLIGLGLAQGSEKAKSLTPLLYRVVIALVVASYLMWGLSPMPTVE